MEVGLQLAMETVDGPPDGRTRGAAGALVDEDGDGKVDYGSASRIWAAWSSVPVIQYRVSSWL